MTMGFGLFGKLPQKRDFVSFGISHQLLHPFETWLQTAVAASRVQLGGEWERFYLVAPVWRFWIGRDILGTCCMGCVMPSVDGVGRYFPLMAAYMAEPGRQIPPPPFAPQGDWFAAVEGRLLSALDEKARIAPETLLEGLSPPSTEEAGPAFGAVAFKGGALWRGDASAGAAAVFRTGGIYPSSSTALRSDRTSWMRARPSSE